jgi:hypothetical protein
MLIAFIEPKRVHSWSTSEKHTEINTQMVKSFQKISVVAGLFLLASSVFADDYIPNDLYHSAYAPPKTMAKYVIAHNYDHHISVYLMGGLDATHLSNVADVTMNNYDVVNTYKPNPEWNALGGVGIGMGFIVYPYPYTDFTVTIDPAVITGKLGTVSGIEYPDSNHGDFDTLSYQFSTRTVALLMESHFAYTAYAWQPEVIVGLGAAFNTFDNFSEQVIQVNGGGFPSQLPFSNRTTSSFAFEVGVGVRRVMYVDPLKRFSLNVGLDYRYLNFGEGELSPTQALGAIHDSLKISTLDAQAIMASLGLTFS